MLMLRRCLGIWLICLAGTSGLWAATSAETKAFKAAGLSFKAGFWERVDRELNEFVQRYPTSEFRAEAVLLQAQARLQLRDFGGAIAALENGRANAGVLADEYQFWLAEAHYQQGSFGRAADLYAEFVKNFPSSPRVLDAVIAEAEAAQRVQDWGRVSRLLQVPEGVFQVRATGAPDNPLVARGWLLLAEALFAQEKLTEAGAALERVTGTGLEVQLVWRRDFLRARLQLAQGQGEAALVTAAQLSLLITNQPSLVADAIALQARICEALQRPDEAITHWRKNLSPTTPVEQQREALLRVASLLLEQGNLEAATATVEQFLSGATNSAAAEVGWLTLGELRLRQFTDGATNALVGAQSACEEFLARFPGSPLAGKAQLNLGWCLWLEEKTAASRAAFAAAVERLPEGLDQAVARFKLGDALAQEKNLAGALEQYQAVAANTSAAVRTNLVERALYQVVRLAGEAGNAPAANAAMGRLLEEFPNGALAERTLMSFGSLTRAEADPAAKREVFLDFIRRSPDSNLLPAVQLAIARTYELEANWPAAVEAYAVWLGVNSNNAARPRAEYFQALATARAGDETNALAQFAGFIAQHPTNDFTPLAQWWVADHYWRAEDFVNAERNYQLLFKNHPQAVLAWEAQLMAGRAAIARQRPDEALGYFTNLTSNLRCPTNIHMQAMFAYGDTKVSMADTDPVAAPVSYREAIQVFSKLQSLYPELPVALLALGRMGDCYFQLGALDTNAAMANYSLATNAYQQVVAAKLADEASRSQAEVGLGLVLERQAALAAVTNQPALLNGALDHYLNVVFAATERTDPKWVKKAGLEALRLTETMGAWPQMVKLCDLLAEKLPSEQAWLARKKARAEEQIRQGGN